MVVARCAKLDCRGLREFLAKDDLPDRVNAFPRAVALSKIHELPD